MQAQDRSKEIKVGQLIKIGGFNISGRDHPNVIKLYRKLDSLKNRPFMAFDKTLFVEKEANIISIIVDISMFAYNDGDLSPVVEAVKIILDTQTWWMFSYDILEVLTN